MNNSKAGCSQLKKKLQMNKDLLKIDSFKILIASITRFSFLSKYNQ